MRKIDQLSPTLTHINQKGAIFDSYLPIITYLKVEKCRKSAKIQIPYVW